jgi:cobaltochelatase CobS
MLVGWTGTRGLFDHTVREADAKSGAVTAHEHANTEPTTIEPFPVTRNPAAYVRDPDYMRDPDVSPAATSEPPAPAIVPTGDALGDALFTALEPRIRGAIDFDPAAVEAAAREAAGSAVAAALAERPGVEPIKIDRGGNVVTLDGIQHPALARLIAFAAAGVPCMLVGPAGSGKTMGGGMLADALTASFTPKSVGPATTAHELLGYLNAAGDYVEGSAFRPYTEGGVLLLDEIDAANPAAMTTVNGLIGNTSVTFPHGVFKRHPDFKIIAAANTFGRGADRQYVGRAQLDAATLNRFAIIEWDYDRTFEGALVDAYAAGNPEHATAITAWLSDVWTWRDNADRLSLRVVISTRTIIHGVELIVGGVSRDDAAQALVFAPLDDDAATRIRG